MRIFAHRGASRACPENSIAAFETAVAMGADGIELDVRRGPDGGLAVRHDPFPDGFGGDGSVRAGTLGLAAALDACGDVVVNVEIKHLASDGGWEPSMAIVDDVLAELRGRGPARSDQWLISSFSWATITAVRERWPRVATAFLTISVAPAIVARTAAAGHRAIHPWERVVDADVVGRARAAGLEVNTWTANDPGRLRELAALGVDGVCTDVPDVARVALGRE